MFVFTKYNVMKSNIKNIRTYIYCYPITHRKIINTFLDFKYSNNI